MGPSRIRSFPGRRRPTASAQPAPSLYPSQNRVRAVRFRDGFRDDVVMADAYSNTVRIGYAHVSGHSQDHQLQLDALAGADCREVVVETASSRGDRPKLRATLKRLKAGDTLVIYKPDRVARSMKELPVLLEDELHARDVCRRSSNSSLADDFHRWHPGFTHVPDRQALAA